MELWRYSTSLVCPILNRYSVYLIGIGAYSASMLETLRTQVGYETTGFALQISPEQLNTFTWAGIEWTVDIFLSRLMVLGTAVTITLLTSIFFNRFDPALGGILGVQRISKLFQRKKSAEAEAPATNIVIDTIQPVTQPTQTTLTPVTKRQGLNLGRLLCSELKLMLKGQRWWWYAGALGFIVASITAPDLVTVKESLYPVTWLWPLLLWSALGAREAIYHTREIVFSSMYPLQQLAITWLVGFLVTCLTGSGVTDTAISSSIPVLYFGLTIILLAGAFWKRHQQLQSE